MKASARFLGVLALGTSPVLLLGGCSSGSGAGGGSFNVTTCSLGCTSAQAGGQVSCSVQSVAVNQEIRIAFTQPVSLASVTATTFQVVEESTGKTPAPSFRLDPADSRVLIYRPRITFDSAGVPSFGLVAGSTYSLRLNGRTQGDPGPFIRSASGIDLGGRLSCTLQADGGVADAVPGNPRVQVFVDVNLEDDPDAVPVIEEQTVTLTKNPSNVYRDSTIRLVFNDLMNPATLVDPITRQSPAIRVNVDADGDLTDPSDQVPVLGDFTIELDQATLRTVVVFTPASSLPSRGLAEDAEPQPLEPRRVVVSLPFSITDLPGNPLANFGDYVFVPEQVFFPVQGLAEDFSGNVNEDPLASGAFWNSATTPGRLLPGLAGGSGRHGSLTVPSGATLVLNTESEAFTDPLFSEPGVYEIESVIGDPVSTASPVVGGVFEFAELLVGPGGSLVFEGANPGRLLVRGEARIDGDVVAAGEAAAPQDHRDFPGGLGGRGGPAGGRGGNGGDRPDGAAFGANTCSSADDDPDADYMCPPSLYDDVNGQPGEGIPLPSTLAPMSLGLAGEGGVAWPQPGLLPDTMECPNCSTLHMPVHTFDVDGLPLDPIQLGPFSNPTRPGCSMITPGVPGAGGSNGTTGGIGFAIHGPNSGSGDLLPLPPLALAGDAAELFNGVAAADVLSLDPELGLLRGGGGGGGGGSHILDTRTNGVVGSDCTLIDVGLMIPANVLNYTAHSSAGGGGGGGAVQVQAGLRFLLNGTVDVSGGLGGRRATRNRTPAGGGGGAGGSLLVQARELVISTFENRIVWGGGSGGLGALETSGGNGGLGRLRFESLPELLPDPLILGGSMLPTFNTVLNMGVLLSSVATVEPLDPVDVGAGAVSGSRSCWRQPVGNFFILEFQSDFQMGSEDLGWDMNVLIDPDGPGGLPASLQSWRGDNDFFADSLETTFGNDLGTSPLVVYFQGGRALAPLEDPCAVDPFGADGILAPGSLTDWVKHPREINGFFTDPTLRSNMVRFQILFDRRFLAASGIQAIEDLQIRVRPD